MGGGVGGGGGCPGLDVRLLMNSSDYTTLLPTLTVFMEEHCYLQHYK